MKICFPTSSGGHLTQLMQLKPFWEGHDRFWVTFDKEDANSKLAEERIFYCYYPTNRNILNLIRNTFLAIKMLHSEQPDLILSTGAAVAVPFFIVGKLLGVKTVYVEIIDRIDSPTLTGKLVYRMSDVFIIQWPELKQIYPRAVCLGSVF